MIESWLHSLSSVVSKYKPKVLCVHCQEVGGKHFNISVPIVESFIEYVFSDSTGNTITRYHCVYYVTNSS